MSEKKKQIVIIESSPIDMSGKMSKALQKIGYETVLVTLTGDIEGKFIGKCYDRVINFDFRFFRINLKSVIPIMLYAVRKSPSLIKAVHNLWKLNPYVVIGRSTPNWLCLLMLKFFRKTPFIYFPYDIRAFCYESLNEAKKNGIPEFEIKAERYCFENSDGIIHKGYEKELEMIGGGPLGNNLKINCPKIHFLPYCLRELCVPMNKNKISSKDREVHIVHAGHISNDERWILPLKEIISQKIHVHLYVKTANLSKKEVYNSLYKGKTLFDDIKDSRYIHIHEPLSQEELAKEMSQYDFGIWYGSDREYSRKSVTLTTGNKISSYFEAGLPIIYFNNYFYLDKLMKKYGTGVTIKSFRNLKRILKKSLSKKLAKNILRAREDYEMNKQIPRMNTFFHEVVEYRKRKSKNN